MFRVIGGDEPILIGQEFEFAYEDVIINEIGLRLNPNSIVVTSFNKSNVQELTPLSFNNRRIAIGDEVMWSGEWRVVYGYYWFDGEWKVQAIDDNDWKSGCRVFSEDMLSDHRTPQDNKVDLSDDELLAEVRKRGLIESKEVIK